MSLNMNNGWTFVATQLRHGALPERTINRVRLMSGVTSKSILITDMQRLVIWEICQIDSVVPEARQHRGPRSGPGYRVPRPFPTRVPKGARLGNAAVDRRPTTWPMNYRMTIDYSPVVNPFTLLLRLPGS